MRLADMVVEVVEVLPAAPGDVWTLLTDVERMGGLGPENVRSAWEGPERGVGARFRGWNEREGLGRWDVPCTVVDWDPPRRFGWAVGDPQRPSAWWGYDLAAVDGGTRVVQRFRHGPGSTYLRQSVEEHPEREERTVAWRAADLAQGMRATLAAAGELLGR